MWKFGLPLLLFVGLAIVLGLGIGGDPSELPSPLIDKPAPTFELPSLLDAKQVTGSVQLAGQPYVVNVWASWCRECRVEHPQIAELSRALPVYGLNWKDLPTDARRWLQQFGNPYQLIGADEDGRVGIDFGVYGAPETFVIDANGIVRYKHVGPVTAELLTQELLPLIEGLK